jgi:hypothetical protein
MGDVQTAYLPDLCDEKEMHLPPVRIQNPSWTTSHFHCPTLRQEHAQIASTIHHDGD